MSDGNGYTRTPVEILDIHSPPLADFPPPRPPRDALWPALILFLLTVVSTLAVGAEFGLSYAQNREPFSGYQDPFALMLLPFQHPRLLALGIPFSFTLLLILFTHEMGHYIACRIYGINASYPYFIPAPTLFGTFGAFIRIRSPITTRRALFDVGLSGPVVGFALAAPAMAIAVAWSKIVPNVQATGDMLLGVPLLMQICVSWFHPHVNPAWILLHPVGRAAWVGLFATALNLLPVWQLDGGHIVYSLASKFHSRISLVVSLSLVGLGILGAPFRGITWIFWGVLLTVLSLRFKHPPLYDPWERLDPARRVWAVVALAIFVLCFMVWPVARP